MRNHLQCWPWIPEDKSLWEIACSLLVTVESFQVSLMVYGAAWVSCFHWVNAVRWVLGLNILKESLMKAIQKECTWSPCWEPLPHASWGVGCWQVSTGLSDSTVTCLHVGHGVKPWKGRLQVECTWAFAPFFPSPFSHLSSLMIKV